MKYYEEFIKEIAQITRGEAVAELEAKMNKASEIARIESTRKKKQSNLKDLANKKNKKELVSGDKIASTFLTGVGLKQADRLNSFGEEFSENQAEPPLYLDLYKTEEDFVKELQKLEEDCLVRVEITQGVDHDLRDMEARDVAEIKRLERESDGLQESHKAVMAKHRRLAKEIAGRKNEEIYKRSAVKEVLAEDMVIFRLVFKLAEEMGIVSDLRSHGLDPNFEETLDYLKQLTFMFDGRLSRYNELKDGDKKLFEKIAKMFNYVKRQKFNDQQILKEKEDRELKEKQKRRQEKMIENRRKGRTVMAKVVHTGTEKVREEEDEGNADEERYFKNAHIL